MDFMAKKNVVEKQGTGMVYYSELKRDPTKE